MKTEVALLIKFAYGEGPVADVLCACYKLSTGRNGEKMKVSIIIENGVVTEVLGDQESIDSGLDVEIINQDEDYPDTKEISAHIESLENESSLKPLPFESFDAENEMSTEDKVKYKNGDAISDSVIIDVFQEATVDTVSQCKVPMQIVKEGRKAVADYVKDHFMIIPKGQNVLGALREHRIDSATDDAIGEAVKNNR